MNQQTVSAEIAGVPTSDNGMTALSSSAFPSGPVFDPQFDEILQSFLNNMPQPTNQSMGLSSEAGSSDLDGLSRATSAIPEFDQTELETWLSQLDNLQPLMDGVSMDVDVGGHSGQLVEQQGENSYAMDSVISILNSLVPAAADASQPFQLPQLSTVVPDTAIDPALLALSMSSTSWNPNSSQPALDPQLWPPNMDIDTGSSSAPSEVVTPSVPSLAHSPISSADSFLETLTPRLSTEPESNVHVVGQDKEIMCVAASTPGETQQLNSKKGKQSIRTKQLKPKPLQKPPQKAATSPQTQYYPPDKRQAIFQRAWNRRDELKAQIERAKIELWEVSVEGGVLGVLGKSK